jgi:hypothetical protein
MLRTTHHRRWLGALAAALLLLGACSEDEPVYNSGEGNNAQANNSANNDEPANNSVNNDANNDEPANNDANNDEPANNDANNDEPANNDNNDNNDVGPANNDNNDVGPPDLVGAACSSNQDCGFQGICLMEEGFTDGYCLTTCTPLAQEPCPYDNPCVALGDSSLCLDGCTGDEDCRQGYVCNDWLTDSAFCFPGQCRADEDCQEGQGCYRGSCGAQDAATGDACQQAQDCAPGGFCLPSVDEQGQEQFPEGYCTLLNCRSDEECPGEASCVQGEDATVCVQDCEPGQGDCRPGYACTFLGGGFACLPGQCVTDEDCEVGACVEGQCGDPEAGLGDACDRQEDLCAPGHSCILPENDDTRAFAGGYCARLGCEPGTSGQCGDDGVCIPVNGAGVCFQGCQEDGDCREGLYDCRLLSPLLPAELLACLPIICDEDQAPCPEGYSCVDQACQIDP